MRSGGNSGSGTTGAVARRMGRSFHGFERDAGIGCVVITGSVVTAGAARTLFGKDPA